MSLFDQVGSALLVSLGESAPFIIVGLLLAGIIHEFVPAKLLKKRLGGSGIAPVVRAVGLGALLPICSCSTIPLGLGMSRSGAGIGTSLAFMTSAPALSPVTLVLGVSILGPMLLGAYSTFVLCGSLLLGLVGNKLLANEGSQNNFTKTATDCDCCCDHSKKGKGAKLANAMHFAFLNLGSEIALSLLVGLLFATIILVFTPSHWILEAVGHPGPMALLAVILLAVPTYTCSVPALLIAGSLIAKGADPSIAVAFLIAGPATNFGELNSIRVGLGTRSATFYFLAVVLLAVSSAYLVQTLPAQIISSAFPIAESSHGHQHLHFSSEILGQKFEGSALSSISLWRWPFVLIILGLAVHGVYTQYIQRKSREIPTFESRQNNTHDSTLLSVENHTNTGWNG